MKDPEKYLRDQNLTFSCPVHPTRPANLRPDFRTEVNHDIYFFSSRDALERFRRHLLRYCGALTDPVSHVRFRPTTASRHLEYHDRPYYFADDATWSAFQAMPDSFAVRKSEPMAH